MCRLTWMNLGGCVLIWHSYWPSSLLLTRLIRRRQLSGYWNSMVYLESPVYVCWPTVSRLIFSPLSWRRTQDTCGKYPIKKWWVRNRGFRSFVANNAEQFGTQGSRVRWKGIDFWLFSQSSISVRNECSPWYTQIFNFTLFYVIAISRYIG